MAESRLFKILYYLLERGRGTAPELADRFEVSVRTIYRDIDRLSQAGIPVYCSRGKGGGIFLMADFVLDKSLLSEDEKGQLLASLQELQLVGAGEESALLTKLQGLFQMKADRWLQVDMSGWRGRNQQGDFAIIKQGILQKKILIFAYLSQKGGWMERKVEPLRLIFKRQDWYLAAFCHLRSAIRIFKLSRIRHCILVDESFSREFPSEEFQLAEPVEDRIKLLLKFDKTAAFRLLEEFPAEAVTERADGFYVESLLPWHDSLYTYLLSFLDQVEVLQPASIRADFIKRLENILERYKS